MKLQKILISFIILIASVFLINTSFGAINMTISPIKYELTANTGATITKKAKLTNNTNNTIHIITGKSDFVANGENGTPTFIRKSEIVYEQELSDWITIDTPEFDIAPEETKTIHFTINIPENATPGGHYGAVFFKNNNSEQSSGANVGINVDYGVLILLKVNGEIDTEIEIGEPIIKGHGGSVKHMDICNETNGDKSGDYYDGKCSKNGETNTNSGTLDNNENTGPTTEGSTTENNIGNNKIKDNCIIDLSKSKYDGKCVDNFDEIISELTGDIKKTDIETNKDNKNKDDNFNIQITIPIENKGNTHVKPTGKIILKDENGKVIKKVGKKIIKNKKGAIIDEIVVDYIPFNDIGGNILPGTKRKYDGSFKGFPYFEIVDGEKVLKYKKPGEYYTQQNLNIDGFVYPWQRIATREQNKTITANFNINYPDENGEKIEYNSAKDFEVKYTEKYLALNPYFFIVLFLILTGLILFLWILWLIFGKKKKVCVNKDCKKKIVKEAKVCPYCETKQYKEKKKKIEKKKPKIVAPLIVTAKKQKLKTKELELTDKIKKVLIENKLKFAGDLTKLNKQEILNLKGIGEVALKQIVKALKKEKMKLKK